MVAALPAGSPVPDEADVVPLELYLSAIPEATRQSLKSKADPTGRTAPAGFALKDADDVVKLLPLRAPRFRPGDALPGKPGWTLERLLGLGGFGEVWLARSTQVRSLFGAVKFYSDQHGRDLAREADLIDRVMYAGAHPNLVPLKDAHFDGPSPWLMFEYVEGGTLADRLHALAALPDAERIPQAVSALRQVAEAAAHGHRMDPPLVHRDLKPANVLYDRPNDRYRVTDYGIGAVTATETLRAETRGAVSLAGRLQTYLRGSHTPLYASPQQRAGAPASPQDDVHALGVIAYQLLTGRPDAEVRADYARQLKRAGVGAELIELIGDCCAEDLRDRPKDAAEVLRRLGAKPKVAPAPAVPPPPPTTKPKAALVPVVPPTSPLPPVKRRVTIPGIWWSRPVHQSETKWARVCSTPGEVETLPDEEYLLNVAPDATNVDLENLSQLTALPNLTSLSLWCCDDVTDAHVLQITLHMAGLTRLSLGNCKRLTDFGVSHIAARLSNLTWLNLTGCERVTHAAVAKLKLALPNCAVHNPPSSGLLARLFRF